LISRRSCRTLFRARAGRLLDLLDIFVGPGLGHVDIGLGDLGEPSLNTASTASAPLGSIMPVSEYIGIVFFSAAR
jgi:hypothetical protein